LLAALLCLLAAAPVRSALACDRLAPWSRLPETGGHYVTPVPLGLTAGALAAPAAMAPTGVDHELRLVSQESLGGSPNQEQVSIWAPYVLSGALVVTDTIALTTESCELARPTSAMLQAVVLTVGVTGVLKWVTGRAWPNDGEDPDAPDRLEHPEHAETFRWFEWKSGAAWPSGHTATMFSAAAALATVTEHRHWVGYVGYAAATGVAAGMWLGDHHWASDIVSGALLGVAVGRSAGLSFRSDGPERQSVLLVPWSDTATFGARAIATF
jgi:membrane-associated phospholipid phosphatase